MESGGKQDFSNYYTANYECAKFDDELKRKMIISTHNLVSDTSFNSFAICPPKLNNTSVFTKALFLLYRLLYMFIDKKVDFEVIYYSFKFRILTDDVISKLFSYTSLKKLLNHGYFSILFMQ